jgi:arabinogalactan oligomer/maltooligosaccharide transport system permease protein
MVKKISVKSVLTGLILHPFLWVACFITIFPALWILGSSLKEVSTIVSPTFTLFPARPTLAAYYEVLFQYPFLLWFRNSLIIAVSTAGLGLFLASTAAYGFSRFDFPGKRAALLSFLVTQMFPGTIIIIPYFILMGNLRLLNSWLGLVLAYSVSALPLNVWMLKGFFDTIPKDLDEAAIVDGCSRFQAFYKIILPLSLPALAVTALFSFMSAWTEFILAYTFLFSEDMYTLPIGLQQAFVTQFTTRWADFSAAALMIGIPVVIVFMLFQKYLISGLTAGAVKG